MLQRGKIVLQIRYLDAIVVKIRENNQIVNKSLFIAMAVNMHGIKEVLGLWMAKTEGYYNRA